MRVVFGISIILFAICFIAVYGYNFFSPEKIALKPPYFFVPGEATSEVNALAFVFFFSLLAFGLSTPIALSIEAIKYASLFSTHTISGYGLLFVLPSFLAAFAATELGQGILDDYEGKGSLLKHTKPALVALAAAIISFIALVFTRSFVVL